MNHQAGLASVDTELTLDDICEKEPVLRALEEQVPLWEPGSSNGYHALTYGWIVGEIIKRIDGRPIGKFFDEEVVKPLGVDSFIGLPESQEHRVAPIVEAPAVDDPMVQELVDSIIGTGTLGWRALTMDGAMLKGDAYDLSLIHI